jgi:hypothetical protein
MPKPRFELVDGQMQLCGVPVPRTPAWRTNEPRIAEDRSWKGRVKWLRSHLLSHFYQLIWGPSREKGLTSLAFAPAQTADHGRQPGPPIRDDAVAAGKLTKEVRRRGGRLLVGFIPQWDGIRSFAVAPPPSAF